MSKIFKLFLNRKYAKKEEDIEKALKIEQKNSEGKKLKTEEDVIYSVDFQKIFQI